MAIKLNTDIWGSNDNIILSTDNKQKSWSVYYPYYNATVAEHQANPNNIITIYEAIYNGKNNKPQSSTNNILDNTICSWLINGKAAINRPYYYGLYYNNDAGVYTVGDYPVHDLPATAYPAYFVSGQKQDNLYVTLNDKNNMTKGYNLNVDFNSDIFYNLGDKEGVYPSTPYSCNTPIVSFGYKSPIYFVYVLCCTEKCFKNNVFYGGNIVEGNPINVDDNNFYKLSLNNYFNGKIDGEYRNKLYPIVVGVFCECYYNQSLNTTEGAAPTRYTDINDRHGVHPMTIVKMLSIGEEGDTTFGDNGVPWYNYNNIYNDYKGCRLVLGTCIPSQNVDMTLTKSQAITTAEQSLINATNKSVKTLRNTNVFLRSPDLDTKLVRAISHYANDYNSPILRLGYKNLTTSDIYREVAYLGLWFCTASPTTATKDINLYSVCNGSGDLGVDPGWLTSFKMPLFDKHMVTTGAYVNAKEIYNNAAEMTKQYPNIKWGWRFNLAPEYEYDPDYRPPKPDDDKYEDRQTDKGSLSTTYHNNSRVNGYTAYILSGKGLNTIKNAINSQLKPPADVTADDWFKLDWYGQDPGSFILATNKFPCDVNVSTLADQIVTIGRTILYTSGDSPTALHAPGAIFQVGSLDFGILEIKPYYNDFRDYAPYSNYIVHIPYFADYTLDPKIWLNHTCKIKIDYDIVTCNAMAEIWRDDMWYDTIYGTFGTPVPFLTYNAGNYQNAVVNAQANLESSKNAMTQSFLSTATSIVGTGVGIATGNIPLAIGSGVGLINSASRSVDAYNRVQNVEYNLKHTAPNPTGTSGVGGVTALTTRNYCTLIISRPQPLHYNKAMYGKTIGFACCETGKLSNYHGLTVCSNTRFNSFTGTQSELAEIQQLLNSGVILP